MFAGLVDARWWLCLIIVLLYSQTAGLTWAACARKAMGVYVEAELSELAAASSILEILRSRCLGDISPLCLHTLLVHCPSS
jgi:hypothetical protein